NDSARAETGAPASGPGLPLPGLRWPLPRRASYPPLGPRRADDTLQPHTLVSATPSGGARGGLHGRARPRWCAAVPAPGWAAGARGAAAVPGAGEAPVEALRTLHEAEGLHIDERTGCAHWLGEGLNVGWAIDVLHPAAAGRRT